MPIMQFGDMEEVVSDVFQAGGLPGLAAMRDRLQRVRGMPGEAQARAELAGVRECVKGEETVLIPEMSRGQYADYLHGALPVLSGHEHLLQPMFDVGSSEYARFMSTRKLVERTGSQGGRRVNLTSNVAEAVSETIPGRASAVRKRYSLVQVITDPEVQIKFDLGESQMNTIRAMAVAAPDAAAARASKAMREARPDLQPAVSAGSYSRSWKWARSSVRENTAKFTAIAVTVEASIIGEDLLVYGDSQGDEPRWFVSGPLCVAEEIYMIHKAVASADTSSVMVALGPELTILGIDISNGVKYECPTIEYHVGDGSETLPSRSSDYTMGQLTGFGRSTIEGMRTRVAGVTYDGKHVASAVRISSRYALVNTHVLDLGDVLLDGKPMMRDHELTKDMWLVRSKGEDAVSWPLREAITHEQVVVCYQGAQGRVVCTSPMVVFAADTSSISMSRSSELVPGMSGGAIVAVRDMALLGIYEGAGPGQAVGSVFSPRMFADVNSGASALLVSPREEVTADTDEITHRMRGRGLGAYLEAAIKSIHTLYTGKVVMGMAVGLGDKLVTSCDPDIYPFSLAANGGPVVFTEREGFLVYGAHQGAGAPRVTRRASYYERVVIIGVDGIGPYYSPELRVVHVGVNGKNFSLEGMNETDLMFQGGLVLALTDAAVLGIYVKKNHNKALGTCEFCVAYPEVERPRSSMEMDEAELAAEVARVFPTLHPGVWKTGLLEEVFTHSSCQKYEVSKRVFNGGMSPLAFVGDAVLRARLGVQLRESGAPTSSWARRVQAVQSNTALAGFFERTGLTNKIRMGGGTAAPIPGSKIHADCLEALAGAVYMSEPQDVFYAFADLVNANPERDKDDSNRRDSSASDVVAYSSNNS